MAGMQFEYDEKGGTFYYFLLSFMALVLIPATYYLWPKKLVKEDPEKQKKQCQCDPCRTKLETLHAGTSWTKLQGKSVKIGLVIGWILFILVAYKTSQVELDFKEFDPFAELGIDREASTGEIKKAYRRLSLQYHPDKETGDSQRFMRITKAYQALTDEEARKNWELHGSPDGPGAIHLGIALPKWIVEKQNSVWVLAAYGLVFMVLLPVVVGIWWRRSIKYSTEQVLMDTTQLYFYFFNKTPNMILKRVLMILGSSMEFEKNHNHEIAERPSDNEEIPMLMRDLPHLNEKLKEHPLCRPFSVKARALIHAHLSRLHLPPNTLERDKNYILKKCPYLLNEMVNTVAQLVALAHAGRVPKAPRLETIENVMRLSQMVVQACWENKSPLLQLPHISDDMLRSFVTKRRNIRTITQFASMNDSDRRSMLRSLSDQEYRDVLNVVTSMPCITMKVNTEVLDDEDTTITAGSIVTVTVELVRESLESRLTEEVQEGGTGVEDVVEAEQVVVEKQPVNKPNKPKVWEKQHKKKKVPKKKDNTYYIKKITKVTDNSKKDKAPPQGSPNGSLPKGDGHKPENGSEEESERDVDSEGEEETNKAEDEDDWLKFQEESKKDNALETKSKETHCVHCPYFPAVKHEWWWLYVCNRKEHSLITAPVQVCSLKTREEIPLKFSAPPKPGVYQLTVQLKSDCYLDFDQSMNIKLDVKAAKKVESHPQWEMSDEEDNEALDASDSSDQSDYDSDDD